MALKNIAIIGANGNLGPHVLKALLAAPHFTISVINRQSSKTKYPDAKVLTVPDDLPTPALTEVLKGQDALVITFAGSYVAESLRLADAAFAAGVKRIIPADFGSCDSADPATLDLLPLMKGKSDVRKHLVELAAKDRQGKPFTWTSLVNGHFFDWGLEGELLKFDVRKRKVYVQDGGDIKFSATNLDTIGLAVVRILEKEEETKNKLLYIHSVWVTQNELTAALEKVTGDKFEVVQESSKKQLEQARPKMLQGDHDATEEVVAVHGIVASDWKGKEGFANELLELPEENLEDIVGKVVASL